jgi:hypothetical protein
VAGHPDDIEYGLLLAEAEINASVPRALLKRSTLFDPCPRRSRSIRESITMPHWQPRICRTTAAPRVPCGGGCPQSQEPERGITLCADNLARERHPFHWPEMRIGKSLSQEARAICAQFGDQACIAAILRRVGNSRLALRDLDGAERNYGRP